MIASLLVLAAVAAQARPLAWDWSADQAVHYHAELSRERDDGDWHMAVRNLEARAHQTNLSFDMSCQATDQRKKGWVMACSLHNLDVSGTALVPDEQEKLDAIFAEYEQHLVEAVVTFEMSALGRIRSLDLEAFEPRNERESQVVDAMRMLLVAPFGQLELELPKAGDDKGKAWKQGGSPLITQLRSSYGTAGAVVIKHTVQGGEGDLVAIDTQGRGTVAYGLAVESDGTKTIAVDLAGSASFDSAAGVLAQRESMVVGRFTASAAYSSPTDHYREVSSLERLDAIPSQQAEPAAPSAEPAPAASEPTPAPEPAAEQEAPAPSEPAAE
jgi:hypothetical protein